MADKKKNKGTSSISGVGGSKRASEIKNIEEVGKARQVGDVKGVKKTGSADGKRSTNQMTLAERERILHLVEDEAKEFFKESGLPPEKQQIIQKAVKMAIDSGIIDEEDDG